MKATAATINLDAFYVFNPPTPAAPQATAYDAANRIVGFTYDARGNLLADATYAYTWDAQNRLTQVKLVSTGAVVASYAYDSDGMRQTSTVGSTTTRYAVDELTDEIVATLDSAGAVVTSFVRDAAGRLIAMVRGSSVYTYLSNAHGDVTALVDAAGAVVARWTYDAWGKPTEYNGSGAQVPLGTSGNPFLFAGYFFDVATGLYYLRARYYDPKTGRFLSMDPEPGKTTDRLSQNPYIYCQNDPVNLTDRTGRRIDAYGGYGDNPTGAQQAAAHKAWSDAKKKWEAEARAKQRADAEADRKARAAMDAARQQQGAETRVRNQLFESVRTGQVMWDMTMNGASKDQIRAYVNGIQDSAAYRQWERGKDDEYAEHRREVAEDSANKAAARAAAADSREAKGLDVAAGGLIGIAVVAGAVAAGAGLLSLGIPAAAPVALIAGGASLVAGLAYSWVTGVRVKRGDISPDDVRADVALEELSLGGGVLGLAKGVGGFVFSSVTLGLSGGYAAVEYSRF